MNENPIVSSPKNVLDTLDHSTRTPLSLQNIETTVIDDKIMCSPSGPSNTDANNSPAAGLINCSSNQQSRSLQSDQQEPSSENSNKHSFESDSLEQMPLPPSNRNSRATTQEMSSKAYNKPGDPLAIAAGQDRFMSTRMTESSTPQHKFNYLVSTSPNCTSDIWAPGAANVTTTTARSITPSSPPDYLRDIDEVLTPCTTLSTTPSRTPSEEDIDELWRKARKSLEIPDLDHHLQNMRNPTATAIARQPQQIHNPYYNKLSSASRMENSNNSPSSLSSRRTQIQSQSRSVEASKELISSSRDSSLVMSSDRKKAMKSPASSLQKAATTTPKREGRHTKEHYIQSRQVLSPSSNNVQGHHYYNQSPLTPQRHHRVQNAQNAPRSPYSHKHHNNHAQSWPHSPQYSHSGQRNHPHSSPQVSKHSHGHGPHQKSQTSPVTGGGSTSGVGGARPTYEVLKTLLRKKACLYEPGTSKAIALITWLVGRELALTHGYFSRQHLQSGVHAVVGDKINSGMITRTKVNRCMQIILNSCFHYIIPRPDGTEENGNLFRESFASTVSDDSDLLGALPHPWHDLKITEECLINKEEDLKEQEGKNTKEKGVAKRIVLLCFNENVRSAEDVLRCHNDFIRDAAITGKLHLSADEWRQFFSLKDDDISKSDTASFGTTSPILKPTGGCDIPYLSFESSEDVKTCLDNKDKNALEPWGQNLDVIGQMNMNELNKLRTTWCCKRYDHDHSMCRFAHVEVNQGWLRRDPSIHKYEDKMCPHITIVKTSSSELKGCYINTCPHGVNCKFAHSREEIDYHPNRYKTKLCEASKSGCHNCTMRDICPKYHPRNQRSLLHTKPGRSNYPKRSGDLSSKAKGCHSLNTKNSEVSALDSEIDVPAAAPIIYHKPAPSSEFEKTLMFPGLQSLYRRNCAMVFSYHVSKQKTLQTYSNFGENWEDAEDLVENNEAGNQCFSLYSAIGGN